MYNKNDETKKQYENLKAKIVSNNSRISELLKNELVSEYVKLVSENAKLNEEFEMVTLDLETQKMMNCNHLFIIGEIIREEDACRIDKYPIHYCVKCGLNSLHLLNQTPTQFLTPLEIKMRSIYQKTSHHGVVVKEVCSVDLAKKIYDDVKLLHPNISDEDLVDYFKIELHHVNQQKEEKHLGLKKMFQSIM